LETAIVTIRPVPRESPRRQSTVRVGRENPSNGAVFDTLATAGSLQLQLAARLYLGDGCVASAGRTYQLRVVLDGAYPAVIDECATAAKLVLPDARVRIRPRPTDNGVIVEMASRRWTEILPQHGRGRKHLRPIVLDPWQREVVDQHPRPFLRGLLFSDGCRTINRFKTKLPSGRVADYAYPRYFFSNQSGDIRGLFCEYCEKLGIRWTQSNPRNISVSHRRSVALLDSFVPAKS
jgi:hypothetical protein